MTFSAEIMVSLVALAGLEIVLGIDNIVFLAIMVERLPAAERRLAYRLGLGAALISRLALLFTLSWMMKLTRPLFEVLGHALSGRDLILLFGGAFLVFKASREIFEKVELSAEEAHEASGRSRGLLGTVVQIMFVDIVFSLDSVITAVGIAKQLWVMSTAMVLAVIVMMLFAGAVGEFVSKNPSMQILALSFLLLIGVLLVAEGFGQHVSKGYVYSAMGFSLTFDLAQLRRRKRALARLARPAQD